MPTFAGMPGRVLGRVRRTGPPGARDRLRPGAAAARAPAQPQRDAGGRADARVQDRRRQRAAAARPQGPARDAAVRRRQRAAVPDRLRQRLRGLGRRHPARAAGARAAGRGQVLRRADAQHRRPAADRTRRQGRGQHPRRRQADDRAEALFDVAAVDAVRALRAAAGSRRPGQAEARVLLRRGAPAVHRRAEACWTGSSRSCG